MKLPGLLFKRGTRRGWVLLAGIGTAGAMTLAPVAAGISGATQPPTAPPATMTTTVVTNATWTSTGVSVLVECPYSTYTTTITSATWIWATLGQQSCTGAHGGPGSVAAGSVTLSTTFTVPGSPVGATLTLAADNGATVSINNIKVATLPSSVTATNFDHVHHATSTFIGDLNQGSNTITIVGTNHEYPGYNPAAVIAKLAVTWSLTTKNLCKDTGWKQGTTPTFVNQGDCVSYVVSHGNDPANG